MVNIGDKLNYLPTQEMIETRENFLNACKNNEASNVFSFLDSKTVNWNEAIEAICNNGFSDNDVLLFQVIHNKQLHKKLDMTSAIIAVYCSNMHSKLTTIEIMLHDKAIVSEVDMNVLFICWVKNNELNIVQQFSHLEPSNNEYFYTAIGIICRFNYCELLKYFREKHTIEQSILNQGFVIGCEFGHLAIVRYLLIECNADIHFNYDNGLRKAGSNHHLDIVQYLLNSNEITYHADPKAVNDDLSITAIMNKNYTLFNYLYNDYGLPITDRVKEYKEFKNF